MCFSLRQIFSTLVMKISMQWKLLKLDHLILATPVAAKSDTLACTSPYVHVNGMELRKN